MEYVIILSTKAAIEPLEFELMYSVNHSFFRSLRVLLLLKKKLKKRDEGRKRFVI